MRKLVVTENITVDGVIDPSGGWFDPAADTTENSDLVEAVAEQSAAADAFLVGRVTFVEMRSYWPNQVDDKTGVTDYLNRVAKYVVSKTLTDPKWQNSTVLRGPLTEEIQALKNQPGADIVATGSIRLVHSLIAAGLVDEYRLFVYPTVVGRGARLFADATTVPPLTLTATRTFRSGVVLITYAITP